MKRKILISLFVLLLFSGCLKNNDIKVINNNDDNNKKNEVIDNSKDKVVENKYINGNNTPISFYTINGNKLNKLSSINTNLTPLEDIGVFAIYPSNEDVVNINSGFGQAFYDEWIKYNTNNNLKIGYNIKFSLNDGRDVSFNVLDPASAIGEYNEYMLTYLYDAYKNRNSSFFSHIEQSEYNSDSLFTSIKLQTGGYGDQINSSIYLSVFTYDSDDDFLDNEYRGNSIYKMNICVNGYEC